MTVYLKFYNGIKYEPSSKCIERITYNIQGFEVKQSKLTSLEMEESGMKPDEFDEYLILHLIDGTTSTFRNSYVDLMKY